MTKAERMIQRARREFRYGRSDELCIVKQIIRAGSQDSERGDLFRQVDRLLHKERESAERYSALVR